jgi:heme exporter protein C
MRPSRVQLPSASSSPFPYAMVALGFLLLLCGSAWGLFYAPAEQYMGDVQRIMYVHVPTAMHAMLAPTLGFICAVFSLGTSRWQWDARLEATIEVSLALGILTCMQGSLWARPTWGVWWDWDPRLTTMAVLVFALSGLVALRGFVDDPVKRAVWTAVAMIIVSADVPLTYMSVRWWNSLHQAQSSPATVSSQFVYPLRVNMFGVMFLMIGLLGLRTRVAALRLRAELAPPPGEGA